jgi:hypothetical protein
MKKKFLFLATILNTSSLLMAMNEDSVMLSDKISPRVTEIARNDSSVTSTQISKSGVNVEEHTNFPYTENYISSKEGSNINLDYLVEKLKFFEGTVLSFIFNEIKEAYSFSKIQPNTLNLIFDLVAKKENPRDFLNYKLIEERVVRLVYKSEKRSSNYIYDVNIVKKNTLDKKIIENYEKGESILISYANRIIGKKFPGCIISPRSEFYIQSDEFRHYQYRMDGITPENTMPTIEGFALLHWFIEFNLHGEFYKFEI